MPNWCSNTALIVGPSKQVKSFVEGVIVYPAESNENGYAISRNLMPMPKALEGTTSPTPTSPEPNPNWIKMLESGELSSARYDELVEHTKKQYESGQRAIAETGYPSWYEWCNSNWGTKWGDCDTWLDFHNELPDGMASAQFTYQTAWSPFNHNFWTTITRAYDIAVIVCMSEEGFGYAGAEAWYGGECAGDHVEDIDFPEELYENTNEDTRYELSHEHVETQIKNAMSECIDDLSHLPQLIEEPQWINLFSRLQTATPTPD